MAKCGFCKRTFKTEQGVKAHLRYCEEYIKQRKPAMPALGSVPKAGTTARSRSLGPSIPPMDTSAGDAAVQQFVEATDELIRKQNPPKTVQQQRRSVLQAAKTQVVDQDLPRAGHVTSAMRGAAKIAIERELADLALEELPVEEVCELAAAIRERVYAPTFTRQAREVARQRVEDARQQKQERDTLAGWIRAERRKQALLQQASQQAAAYCEERGLTGWVQLCILNDIGSRLESFLSGEEPMSEAQGIVRMVLEARFAEADATVAAARAAEAEQWQEELVSVLVLAVVLAAPFVAGRYPEQVLAILNWIERTLGWPPQAQAGAPTRDASPSSVPPASAESRPPSSRRLKKPVSPSGPESAWGNAMGPEPGHA